MSIHIVGSVSRTNDVNIQAVRASEIDLTWKNKMIPQIYGAVANAVPDALDNIFDTIVIDIIRRDQLESDGIVVLDVADALVSPIQFRALEINEGPRTAILQRIPACTLVFVMSCSS